MAETLQVPCFRYKGQPLAAPINVEAGGDGRYFVRCFIRDRFLVLTPEERVRQALIWFFMAGGERATTLGEHIRIGVEERSLDVAGFATDRSESRFTPSVVAVILETKRQEEDIADHYGQLERYLRRERCRAGLLFNGRHAAWATLTGEFPSPLFEIAPLDDLLDAEERIYTVAVAASGFLRECQGHFVAALGGNFDALSHLVSTFGSDASLTFSLSIRSRGSLGSVGAFNLSTVSDSEIGYWIKGMPTKRKLILTRTEFHSLRSIRPS